VVYRSNPTLNNLDKAWLTWRQTGITILAVTALICLQVLLTEVMGDKGSNEVDVLPLARQYADSNWLPQDWYLRQPPGYRLLFQALFGWLIVNWGFLLTCLVGRIMCYSLVAAGIVLIGRRMGLSPLLMLLAIAFFLQNQSLVAGEWLVGGLEAKSVAYGLVLLAIGLMLEGRYLLMALLLGLATSFHVLVGIWAFLTVLVWLVLKQKSFLTGIQFFGLFVPLYFTASAFGIGAAVKQLITPTPTGSVLPSYVYVFVRLPHHLNPMSWPAGWWVKPLAYMLVLTLSIGILWYQQSKKSLQLSREHVARIRLAEFTLLSMVPFIVGLAISPFDSNGSLLQYYPFRLGDVMLPLNTCLLFACVLKETLMGKRRWLLLICILLLSWKCSTQSVSFKNQLLALREFPSQEQNVDPQWRALCTWIRDYTPRDATVLTPPVEFSNFTWLAERASIVKFKLFPQNKQGIPSWYERISDLGGDLSKWLQATPTHRISQFEEILTHNYNHLATDEVKSLMVKYHSNFFVAHAQQQLDLPIVYSNSLYTLYTRSN